MVSNSVNSEMRASCKPVGDDAVLAGQGLSGLIAVVILTYNESLHLARALDSVADIASEVFVIDSGSNDGTVELAKSRGAKVVQHPFVNQAKQFQWALDHVPISAQWVMRLDADEVIESDLAQLIAERLPSMPADVVGINLDRKHIFMGRWVRFGGRYPLRLLRIWRRGHGRVEDRWMDEHVVVWGGRTVTFKGGFADHNLNDLTYFIDKHNRYATREAIDAINLKLNLFPRDTGLTNGGASLQASSKRWLKEAIYNRIPFTFSAALYFLWRYVVQLGCLDGRTGLIYHFLQGFWYRFLVGAKILELERSIAHLESNSEIIEELSRLTGHRLSNAGD
jgi:glycosyltransferase involved in cell wall biosynthesis